MSKTSGAKYIEKVVKKLQSIIDSGLEEEKLNHLDIKFGSVDIDGNNSFTVKVKVSI